MKFFLKLIFISFAFIQIASAGRMYDPEIGRFISRDPLGYVDGMSMYNAYFAEKFALDPTGHKIQTPPKSPPKKFNYFAKPFSDNKPAWLKPNWSFSITEHVKGGCCFLEVNMAIDPKFYLDSNRKDISGPDHKFTTKSGKTSTIRAHEEEHWHITIKHYKAAMEELKAYEYFQVPCDKIIIWKNMLTTIYNLNRKLANFDNNFHDYMDYGRDTIKKDGEAIENAIDQAIEASRATGR